MPKQIRQMCHKDMFQSYEVLFNRWIEEQSTTLEDERSYRCLVFRSVLISHELNFPHIHQNHVGK